MTAPRRRGRPRDGEADGRILDAALELLLAKGYDGFSTDEVAARAGCAKTTLYRRWPTQDHLIVAVVARMQNEVEVVDTGDLHHDLIEYLTAVAAGLNWMRKAGRPDGAGDNSAGVVAEIAATAARHPDIGAAVQQMFALRNAIPLGLLERAQQRGALPGDVDPEVLFDQLAGALYYRLLATGKPIGPAYVRRLVSSALAGMSAMHHAHTEKRT